MTFQRYLIVLGICSGLCWLAFFCVLFGINPAGGFVSLLLFYGSLFCALLGTFAFLGFLFRVAVLKKDEIAERGMRIAARQSVLFSFLLIVALILQSQRWLTWWNLLILLGIMLAAELLFISVKKMNK